MMDSARPVKILITCLGFLALISLVFGFSDAQTSQVTTPDRSSTMFSHVAIMPFLKGRFESPDGQVDKPLSQRLTRIVFDQQSLRDDAEQIMTRMVADTLKTGLKEKLIPTEVSQSVFDEISKSSTSKTPRQLAVALGNKLDAELVVVGSVWRYRDRGVLEEIPGTPSSVAFEIYLVEVATGKRLWRGKFDETQKTLSKDVIRGFKQLKMGARWLTADELARYGVKKVLKDFPIH